MASSEFREKKAYLLDKKRFEKTEMFKQVQEYDKLKKNEDIIWYFKVKDSNKFDILKHRELTFSDEFNGDKLDTSKWLTNYYWGEKLLKDRYSVESDLQAYTEKDNFELRNSILKINTQSTESHRKSLDSRKRIHKRNSAIHQELSIPVTASGRNMEFSQQRSNLEILKQETHSGCLPTQSPLISISAVHRKEKYGLTLSQINQTIPKPLSDQDMQMTFSFIPLNGHRIVLHG